jgi:hypothetical protein
MFKSWSLNIRTIGRLGVIIKNKGEIPNRKETSTNRRELRIDESSRASLTALSALLRYATFNFKLKYHVGTILGSID